MTLYVGVLSGTSMDSVDAVLAYIRDDVVRVEAWHEAPYPQALRLRLEAALNTPHLGALECWRLDAELGEAFGDTVNALLRAAGVPATRVRAIGSHGQTIYHAPDARPALTVQIGDPNVIARRTGIEVVADFRRMDLAAGGQGAPLAPAFHAFAFSHPDSPRAVLNVGGIANLSRIAAGGRRVTGSDTGPGNTLMDLWAARHRGTPYDADGRFAAAGRVAGALLVDLLCDPYFERPAPKSTGREYFNAGWLESRLLSHGDLAPADVQRTLLELTSESVARALEHGDIPAELFVCGGGALNPVLMQRLGERLRPLPVHSTDPLGIPPKTVEGAAFAWLAACRLDGIAAVPTAVTGARETAVLGGVYRATALD